MADPVSPPPSAGPTTSASSLEGLKAREMRTEGYLVEGPFDAASGVHAQESLREDILQALMACPDVVLQATLELRNWLSTKQPESIASEHVRFLDNALPFGTRSWFSFCSEYEYSRATAALPELPFRPECLWDVSYSVDPARCFAAWLF